MRKRTVIVGLLTLCLGVLSAPRALSAEEGKEAAVKIPDTVAGIWHDVAEHEEHLGKIIASKKLADVHVVAFTIRDLVKALPGKSKDLAADKLAKVKTNVRLVEDLAKHLDESGDANDQALTETNFKKLQGVLKTVKSQYPQLQGAATPGAGPTYTCSMHPDVVQHDPGSCPKCGMKLVPSTKKAE